MRDHMRMRYLGKIEKEETLLKEFLLEKNDAYQQAGKKRKRDSPCLS